MRWSAIICLSIVTFACASPVQRNHQAEHRFAQHMHQAFGFNSKKILTTLRRTPTDQHVLALMQRPYEGMPWQRYLKHLITPKRLAHGTWMMHHYRRELGILRARYHVPPAVIIAIMGMESNYGQHQATHQALRTLTTLSFAFPRRAHFFTHELEQLFLLAREQGKPITHYRGSYAGALGMPQFMPSNYRKYAVAWGNDHPTDLFHNPRDTLASIAHYLQAFGWQGNQTLLIQPSRTDQHDWSFKGTLGPKDPRDGIRPLRFGKNPGEKWLAGHNFQVILHYNRSPLYAFTVAIFSQYLQRNYDLAYRYT